MITEVLILLFRKICFPDFPILIVNVDDRVAESNLSDDDRARSRLFDQLLEPVQAGEYQKEVDDGTRTPEEIAAKIRKVFEGYRFAPENQIAWVKSIANCLGSLETNTTLKENLAQTLWKSEADAPRLNSTYDVVRDGRFFAVIANTLYAWAFDDKRVQAVIQHLADGLAQNLGTNLAKLLYPLWARPEWAREVIRHLPTQRMPSQVLLGVLVPLQTRVRDDVECDMVVQLLERVRREFPQTHEFDLVRVDGHEALEGHNAAEMAIWRLGVRLLNHLQGPLAIVKDPNDAFQFRELVDEAKEAVELRRDQGATVICAISQQWLQSGVVAGLQDAYPGVVFVVYDLASRDYITQFPAAVRPVMLRLNWSDDDRKRLLSARMVLRNLCPQFKFLSIPQGVR